MLGATADVMVLKPTHDDLAMLDGQWRDHPQYQGCVGHWLFHENGGATAYDISGNNNHGTLTGGATWIQGSTGPAISLAGGSYVNLGHVPLLQFTKDEAFTICTRTMVTAAALHFIFAYGLGNDVYSIMIDTGFVIVNNGIVGSYDTYTSDSRYNRIASSANAIAQNKFFHLMYVHGLGNTTANDRLYINAVPNSANVNSSVTSSIAYGASHAGRIGQNLSGDRYYTGVIEYLQVFNRAIPPEEAFVHCYDTWAPFYPTQRFWAVAIGITFDAASNSGYQSTGTSYSWSHTCTGTNRFLSVDVAMLSLAGTTVSGITYNGVALSLIGVQASVSGTVRTESWGLIAPATGSNTIVVTFTGSIVSGASAGTAVSYAGVHQTSPTEAFNGATATNVGAADATVSIVTVANNDWVHAAVGTDDTAVTANQTSRNNVTGALGSGADEDTGPKTPAGSQTMSYTNVAALATWAIAGYGIRPITASSLARITKNTRAFPLGEAIGMGWQMGR